MGTTVGSNSPSNAWLVILVVAFAGIKETGQGLRELPAVVGVVDEGEPVLRDALEAAYRLG